MKDISNNLKGILKRKGLAQKDLAEMTGISTSNISNIMRAQTLLSPGNLHIVAKALNVEKGEIDPTYKSSDVVKEAAVEYITEKQFNPLMIFDLVERYTDDEIIEKYHHQDDGGTLSEQQVRMHLQYVRFLKTQK